MQMNDSILALVNTAKNFIFELRREVKKKKFHYNMDAVKGIAGDATSSAEYIYFCLSFSTEAIES